MLRRSFLAAAAATLASPAVVRGAAASVLKFIPQSDVTILDPIWTTAYVTRNHGFLIFDTLYGIDDQYRAQPQMVAGHTVENDGKLWRLRLRDGLKWHDGEPVLARDCVASIARWGKRDPFGQTLLQFTDELTAADDKTIQFKLKQPFALLPDGLGKPGSNFCAMMPERLAKTDAFTQITEMVGSGPFRFKADERVVGSQVVYERNADYVPRQHGTPQWTSGPKVANFDRVEWRVISDPGTAAAALQTGEVDWWENPTSDMLPLLRQAKLKVEVTDPTGLMACMRLNELHPPFDNPAIRRALLKAVDQRDFMIAVAGDDPQMSHVPAGIFCPGTPMASNAGLEIFAGKRDYAAAKQEIVAAGYKGEKVAVLVPTDFPILKAEADVGADLMQKIGLNVDYQAMDWGAVVKRRAMTDPPDQGGWSVFHTFWSGLDQANPVGHVFLRGNGREAMIGWPTSPKIEELRSQWISAPDVAAQKQIAEQLQLQAFADVPYVPLGQAFQATSFRRDIGGVLNGFVIFWNVRRAA
ncbi:MAG: ABC transporter substrate-binding protein [Alphaproteobacteria bacterium]|nr:ABC transporter substrate-binding protein [Alphaproteobacteria bacterium]